MTDIDDVYHEKIKEKFKNFYLGSNKERYFNKRNRIQTNKSNSNMESQKLVPSPYVSLIDKPSIKKERFRKAMES